MLNKQQQKDFKLTIVFFLFLAIMLLLSACGSRKVKATKSETTKEVKQETKKEVDKKIEYNVVKTLSIDSASNEIKETTKYEPVDPTKPSKVNDEEFINTTIIKEKTTLKNDKKVKEETTDETVVEEAENLEATEAILETTKIDDRNVDREQFNYWKLLWLLIPLGIVIFLLKKYTKVLTF